MILWNSVVLLVFAGLAIQFGKWWVIFFALIFMLYPKS